MSKAKTPNTKKKAAKKQPKNERNPKHRESFNDLLERAAPSDKASGKTS